MSSLLIQRPTTSQCRAAAKHLRAQRPDCTHVYVAAIRQVDGRFDLEVEVDAGTIAYVLPAGTARLRIARHEAKKFAKALSASGVTVFATRTAWDAHLEAVDAADSADTEVAA